MLCKILSTLLYFIDLGQSLTSFPKTPHDFEDSRIDAGSGSEVAEVSPSTVNYLG